MKLSITQIILGILVIIIACFVMQWLFFGVESLFDEQVPDVSGVLVQDYTPQNETLFTIARYASCLLIGLGLAVLITGALWWKAHNKKSLAVTQIITGVLIVIVSAFIALWGLSFDCIVPIEGGPVLGMNLAKNLTMVADFLGLVVLVLGTIQLQKERKAQNI